MWEKKGNGKVNWNVSSDNNKKDARKSSYFLLTFRLFKLYSFDDELFFGYWVSVYRSWWCLMRIKVKFI